MIDRCCLSAISISVLSAFVLSTLSFLLQFSPLAPFASINACYSMMTFYFFVILFLQMVIIFVKSLFLSMWIFSVHYETNLNILKVECMVAAFIVFTGNVLLALLLSFSVPKQLVWFSSRSFFLLWLVSTVISAFYTAYTVNFQLRIIEWPAINKIKQNYYSWLIEPAIDGAIKTMKLFCIAWIISLNIAFMLRPMHSSLPSLLAFWHLPDLLLLLFSQWTISCLEPLAVNFFVMKPIEFAIPSVFYATAEINPTTITLIDALESKEPIMRLFALYQLQRICSGSPIQRKPFYDLSQPGGHPRNWQSLRDTSLSLIRNARDRLQIATHCKTLVQPIGGTLSNNRSGITDISKNMSLICANKSVLDDSNANGSLRNASSRERSGVLNELYEAKQSFFFPPKLNPRSADAFLSERLQSRRLIGVPHFVDNIMDKLRDYWFVPPPFLSSYDTLCTSYAIKALSNVISHSLTEDEFGVVQKDLKAALSELTRFSIAIDAYVRANGLTSKSSIEQNIFILDEVLAIGLKAIRDIFGSHIGELDLHPAEREVFQVLV